MNKTIKWIAIGLNVCAINAFAAEPACPWYLNVGAGPALEQDLKPRNGPGNAELDLGARFDLGLGYNFNQNWAAELESGTIWTTLKNSSDTSFYQVPVLVNGIFKIPTKSAFAPYVGVGLGGVATTLNIDNFGSDTDFTFAYQAQAGVNYALSANATIGFGYKFLGTLEHDWTINGGSLQTKGTYTHALLLSFNWNF